MSAIKTVPTGEGVDAFIAGVEHPGRREDAQVLVGLMQRWTGWEPRMWGPSIIGFGRYDYTYESGHSGSMCVVGFSPRKANMVIYVDRDGAESQALVEQLGKVKASVGCLYLGRLASVDLKVLEKLVRRGVTSMKRKWPVFDG